MSVCQGVLEEALGRPVTEAEADRLFKKINRRAAALRSANPTMGYNEALGAVEREFAEAAEFRQVLAKRNAVLNQTKRIESTDYIKSTWDDRPGDGLKAILVGTQDKRQGARSSIGADQQAAEDFYLGGLIADIAKVEGGLDAYTKATMDGDIARALFALSNNADTSEMPDIAVGVAKAIRKWQDYGRIRATEAGAWVGQTKGYIASQFHDMTRVTSKDEWVSMAMETFDLPRMADEMEVDLSEMPKVVEGLYASLESGVHLKPEGTDVAPRKGLQSVGKKLSHERVIHFKDADSWSAYNRQYGLGNLHEAVTAGLRKQAKATALMNMLGPNYEMTFDKIVSDTRERMRREGKPGKDIQKFDSDAKSMKRLYLQELDGTLNIPGNDTFATASASIRAVQSMASLGGATLSSVSDLGVMALGAKYNGMNALELQGKMIGNLFSGVPSAEKLGLLADLGTVMQSLSGKMVANRFSPDDSIGGRLGRLQEKFYTLNLQNRWTDAAKEATSELLSANLARNVDVGWNDLGRLGETMSLYGIDEGKWDIFRQVTPDDLEGTKFLSPSMMDELPDEPFSAYLQAREVNPTPTRIRDLREEMKRQFRAYFVDQRGYMVLEPDAATRGVMKQGTQKGTGIGEAVRFVAQFKSFPVAYGQRIIGREFKQGGFWGVGQMIALTTLYGYAASALKDLSKGKVPRDPTDWRTWVAAMQQGGGAGLYGDVLFSQVLDRRFGDASTQLLGPTFSDVFGSQGLAGIAGRLVQGQDAGAASVRFIQGNTPFLNLFYARIILDYAAFYHLQEWMNPGSLGRMESEMEQRSGQQFIAPPSQVVN